MHNQFETLPLYYNVEIQTHNIPDDAKFASFYQNLIEPNASYMCLVYKTWDNKGEKKNGFPNSLLSWDENWEDVVV